MIVKLRLELSNEERSYLAAATGGTHPVTRKEVTDLVNDFIKEKSSDQHHQDNAPAPKEADGPNREGRAEGASIVLGGFSPSRGDEDYLAQPSNAEIAAACSRLLDDTALIENFAWTTIERNRK